MPTCQTLLLFASIILTPFLSRSQASASQNTWRIYHDMAGDQSGLYNGGFYYPYPAHIHNGHPYFSSSTPLTGTVWYDGSSYENIPLLYDEVRDELVTPDFKKQYLIQLVKDKVDSFMIQQHRFIRVDKDSLQRITPGFYELLLHGKARVLKKEKKIVKEKLASQAERIRSVETSTRYFVAVNNSYHEIKSSRSLMNLFGAQKNTVSDTLKRRHIRFRSARESFIVEATALYNHLTP